jgi:hypothetical protein
LVFAGQPRFKPFVGLGLGVGEGIVQVLGEELQRVEIREFFRGRGGAVALYFAFLLAQG